MFEINVINHPKILLTYIVILMLHYSVQPELYSVNTEDVDITANMWTAVFS